MGVIRLNANVDNRDGWMRAWNSPIRANYQKVELAFYSLQLDFGHSPRNQIAGKWQAAEGLIAGAWEAT
jgi:hypothetical protein